MNASLTFDLVRRHMPRAIGVGNPATASLGRGARGGWIKPSRALDQISGWQASVRAIAAILALCFAAFSFAASFNPDPASKWSGWQSGPAAVNTPELRDGRVYKLSPAQIIYYSAKENGLNPLLLLVKLQAEQGLIKNSYSDTELQRRLDRAVGYGVLESNPTATKWFGFYPQLVGMSYEFSQMRKKKDFHAAFLEYTPHEDKYKELQTIYAQYAVVMNRVSGRHYSASPGSSGYLDDFRDVSAQHIQAFLGEFPGALKNASLFSGSAPASSGGAGATVGTDGMQFVSETLPDGSVVQGGANVAKSWTLRNAGGKPWDANYCLRPSGANVILGAANVCVNGVIAPGASFVFSTTLRIPPAQATEQTLRQSWRFTNPAGTQVGSEIWAQVKVAAVSVGGSGPGSNPGSSPAAVAMPLSPMPGASQSFAHSLNYKTSACNFVGLHTGVDYAPVSVGQAVFAIADGTVSKTGQIGKTANSLGSYVVVDHPQLGIRSYYLHIVPGVSAGAKVSAGARIASIANTTAVGKHLHLEIQKGGFNVLDSNGKAKLFVGHSTTPIGQCGYVTRQSDLAKGWVNPAEFLKHPVSIGGTGQHQPDHEDVDEEDFPSTGDQKRRADVVAMLLNSLAAKGHKFAGSLDDQARAAGLITSTTLARPQDTASRMEVALFAYRALQKFAPTALTGAPGNFPIEEFRDAPDGTAAEYQRVVNALAGASVVTGSRDANGEMRFYPTRKASTAEVQAFVDRTTAKITATSASPMPTAPGEAMQFVSETLPDNTFIAASVVTVKSWTLRNTGSTTWTPSYCLRPTGAQPLGSSSVCVTGNVPPNTTYVFNVNLQGPAAQATEQVYRQEWALRNASNNQIGTAVYALVKVRGASSSTPPSPPIPAVLNIQSIGVSPQSAQAGHQMTFQVAVDNGATVQRVELVFPDAGVTEAMTQAGANNWQRSRVMAQSGSNRPYRINVIKKDGTTVTRDGTYSVTAVPAVPTPPPPAPIVVNIQSVSASPSSVTVGQTMTFSTSVDNPGNVQKVELRFQDVGVVEAMTQSGSMWVRSRTMTQTGGNRSFQVVVTKRDGQTVTRDGWYSVASAPVAPPAPPPVAPPSAPPNSGGEVPVAPGCSAGGVKVCGVDGRTYANACTLMKYGVSKARNGPC